MKFKFTKIRNNHNNLRDDVIICDTCSKIIIGQSIILTAPGRGFAGATRVIETSPVKVINNLKEGITRVTTQSDSVYEIEEILNKMS